MRTRTVLGGALLAALVASLLAPDFAGERRLEEERRRIDDALSGLTGQPEEVARTRLQDIGLDCCRIYEPREEDEHDRPPHEGPKKRLVAWGETIGWVHGRAHRVLVDVGNDGRVLSATVTCDSTFR